MTKGVKYDEGKNRLGLLMKDFANALHEAGLVTTFGANKYSDGGWKSVPNAESRYEDALARHYIARLRGQVNDTESKLPHLAHEAWNALALLELELKERDKPKVTVADTPPRDPMGGEDEVWEVRGDWESILSNIPPTYSKCIECSEKFEPYKWVNRRPVHSSDGDFIQYEYKHNDCVTKQGERNE